MDYNEKLNRLFGNNEDVKRHLTTIMELATDNFTKEDYDTGIRFAEEELVYVAEEYETLYHYYYDAYDILYNRYGDNGANQLMNELANLYLLNKTYETI